LILAAIAGLGLGMASANTKTNPHNSSLSQQGDRFNYMRGGGG
jgi:hypothetical protein